MVEMLFEDIIRQLSMDMSTCGIKSGHIHEMIITGIPTLRRCSSKKLRLDDLFLNSREVPSGAP